MTNCADRHRPPRCGSGISEVKLRILDAEEDGLLGFASCVLDGRYFLNNIAIRQGEDGQLFLTYPAGKSAGGVQHHHWNPISKDAAQLMENAILGRMRSLGRE